MAADQWSATDVNSKPTLTAVSNADGTTIVRLWADPVTHRLLVSGTSSAGTFVDNEVVAGSATTFTLANTPIVGSQHVYANGQRLIPGGVDYTIAGAVITTVNSWSASTILADYRM